MSRSILLSMQFKLHCILLGSEGGTMRIEEREAVAFDVTWHS